MTFNTRHQKEKGVKAMNLIISLLLTNLLIASPILNISHSIKNKQKALLVKDRLVNFYKVPKELISVEQNDCKKISENRVELCIQEDGQLKIKQKNSELISSLQIFNRPY